MPTSDDKNITTFQFADEIGKYLNVARRRLEDGKAQIGVLLTCIKNTELSVSRFYAMHCIQSSLPANRVAPDIIQNPIRVMFAATDTTPRIKV